MPFTELDELGILVSDPVSPRGPPNTVARLGSVKAAFFVSRPSSGLQTDNYMVNGLHLSSAFLTMATQSSL